MQEAQLFGFLDKNGGGEIKEEVLYEILFDQGLSRDLHSIFRAIDKNSDGKIQVKELVTWILEEAPLQLRRKLLQQSGRCLPSDAEVDCSEWFANAIAEAGVTHVFGGHGGALVPMVNAVVNHPSLTWVPTRNEANASLMASACAKLTGCMGVCIATSGPGATNLTTGLMEAHLDQVPLLALTGLKPREGLGYSEFQDVDQSRLFAGGGLSYSVNVASPQAFVPLVRDAVARAVTWRTAVHLAVPVDVQAAPCPVPLMPLSASDALSQITQLAVDRNVTDAVALDLHVATRNGDGRIIIAVGHRCIGDAPMIIKLAERIHAPILTRLDAKGCCDESHPLVWGVIGVHGKPGLEDSANLISTADLVLAFGVHDCGLLLCNLAGMQVRPMVHFEPNGVCASYNAKYGVIHSVIGSSSRAIAAILDQMDKISACDEQPQAVHSVTARAISKTKIAQLDTTPPWEAQPTLASSPLSTRLAEATHTDLWDAVHTCMSKDGQIAEDEPSPRLKYRRFEVESKGDHRYCHPAEVLRCTSIRMDADDVLCVDTGDCTLWASLCAALTKGQRTLSSERLGTMGYALCAGIAACLIREETGRAVVVAGDGGMQMTLNELGTVRQLFASSQVTLRMIIIVFDNAMLGRVHFGFKGALGCELGPSPDFVALARAYGGDGVLLDSADMLQEVMDRAFACNGLFLIHALVDSDLKAEMSAFKDNSIKIMASG